MSDLIPTVRGDETLPAAPAAAVPADLRLPDHTVLTGSVPVVDDPELARLQIEQTRARMSETIDQIEGALIRKKERLEERLDVLAPARRLARERPWLALGGVVAGGLLLGYLTGGGDDDDAEGEQGVALAGGAVDPQWEDRARTWERRARRLMRVANEQEGELLALRGRLGEQGGWEPRRPRRRRGLRRLLGWKDALGEGLSLGLAEAIHAGGDLQSPRLVDEGDAEYEEDFDDDADDFARDELEVRDRFDETIPAPV